MMSVHMTPAAAGTQRFIKLVASDGHDVKTLADVLKILRRSRWKEPIYGLVRLGLGDRHNPRCASDVADARRYHRRRLEKLADRIAVDILQQDNPLSVPINQVFTVDLKQAIEKKVHRVVGERIAHKLRDVWPYRKRSSTPDGRSRYITVEILGDFKSRTDGRDIVIPADTRLGNSWNGDRYRASVYVTERAVKHFWPQPALLDGAFIADILALGNGEYSAVWAEQSLGYSLKAVRGFIIAGKRIVADDIVTARDIAASNMRKRSRLNKPHEHGNLCSMCQARDTDSDD